MYEINWGLIKDGEQFESLVRRLVYFEDSKADLFGRPGKDAGMDCLSGDGKTVFQCKFHRNESASVVIRDALDEVEKIKKYKNPKHTNFVLWSTIENWVLATPVEFNPQDDQNWKENVEPVFEVLRLKASYWSKPILEGKLAIYPALRLEFFEDVSSVFLPIQERQLSLDRDDPFLGRIGAFVGRELELQNVITFLSNESKQLLEIFGPGGVGKTRFLVEAGIRIASNTNWKPVWVEEAAVSTSSRWFEGLPHVEKLVFILDDPEKSDVVHALWNAMAPGRRAANCKLIIAARHKDSPALRPLSVKHGRHIDRLTLGPLKEEIATDHCRSLLKSSKLREFTSDELDSATNAIVSRSGRIPVWISLGIDLVEKYGSVATMGEGTGGLADYYINEALNLESSRYTTKQFRNILRWTALFGKVNISDEAEMQLLAINSGLVEKASDAVREMEDRRLLAPVVPGSERFRSLPRRYSRSGTARVADPWCGTGWFPGGSFKGSE